MRLTVFTSVLGDTDPLRPPLWQVIPRRADVKFVCFADRRIRPSYGYEIVPFDSGSSGPCLASRELKILANHPALGNPEFILWHDAAFQLRHDPVAVATKHMEPNVDMLAFRHPHRDRIEDEAVQIARLGMMCKEVLDAQIQTYRSAGFVDQKTITSTGYSIRRCTPQVRAFNECWWSQVAHWGYRDQMSVDYALWLNHLVVKYLPGHYRDNPYARWYPASKN